MALVAVLLGSYLSMNWSPAEAKPRSASASASPAVSISPSQIYAGDNVKVTASGFSRNRPAKISMNGQQISNARTDRNGGFVVTIRINSGTSSGTHQISVSVGSTTASTELTVVTNTQQATPTPTPLPPTPAPTATPTGDWRLVWADEFSGSALDPAKWTSDRMPHGGTGYFDTHILPANSVVRDGRLDLLLKRESVAGKQYTTGLAQSQGKFEFRYGRVEIRARHSGANPGVWPALWLQRDAKAYPEAETWEIDIMEALGNTADRWFGHIHHWDAAGTHRSRGTGATIAGFDGAWHVYELEWSPSGYVWRVDGVERLRVAAGDMPPFDQPMCLILNNGLGGWNDNQVTSATVLPDVFSVDYVRVYQR